MSVEGKVKETTGLSGKAILAICVLVLTVPMAAAWIWGKVKGMRSTTTPGA